MAIDFTKASMTDWDLDSERAERREARAAEKHAAWQQTQEQKALDRQAREAEKTRKREIEAVDADVDFATYLSDTLEKKRKELESRLRKQRQRKEKK